jgi:hypothetical protein
VNADVAGAIRVIVPSGDGQGRYDADVVHASPRSRLPFRRLRVLSHLARVALIMKRRQVGGKSMSDQGTTRREVIKKAVYVTPVLLTLKANLAFASTGSGLQAPSDYVLTGGSGQPNPVEPTPPELGAVPPNSAAPGGSTPPLHDPPPAESDSAPSDHPAHVSSESPPAGNAGPDNAAPPPQDDQVTDHPGKRRRSRRHRHHVL